MSLYSPIFESFKTAQETLEQFLLDETNVEKVVSFSETLAQVFESGGKVLICGNGGSACDAMHFAEEFTGRFRKNRRALPALALADSSHITCVGNDYGFDEIFSRGVEAFGKPGDMLIGISTSGNSRNVIRAMEVGKSNGLLTVGFLGKDGGKLAGFCDQEFIIPGETSDRIQELHMTILHIAIEGVERLLFPECYA